MPATDSAVGTDFDWFSPEVIRDPQKYDGMIREAGPVVYSPQYDVWATGRHNQIELMMRDWRTFSSTRPPFEEIGQPMILLSDDPPDHQRVRTVISKGMSPPCSAACRTTSSRGPRTSCCGCSKARRSSTGTPTLR